MGDPIGHSRSPALQNAAIAACGLDAVYIAFPVPTGQAEAVLQQAGHWGIRNLNVTMPHKYAAWKSVAHCDPQADLLQSVNTIRIRDNELHGTSTDGVGVVGALESIGVPLVGARCAVLGAGATARSAVLALGTAGAQITVAARNAEAAEAAAQLAAGASWCDLSALDLADSTIVVHATPVGMHGEPPLIDVAALPDNAAVLDCVYGDVPTPLWAAAHSRGLIAIDGVEMLLHQAAASFEIFSGCAAPLDAMRAALSASVGHVGE